MIAAVTRRHTMSGMGTLLGCRGDDLCVIVYRSCRRYTEEHDIHLIITHTYMYVIGIAYIATITIHN